MRENGEGGDLATGAAATYNYLVSSLGHRIKFMGAILWWKGEEASQPMPRPLLPCSRILALAGVAMAAMGASWCRGVERSGFHGSRVRD